VENLFIDGTESGLMTFTLKRHPLNFFDEKYGIKRVKHTHKIYVDSISYSDEAIH
jgi:hypothetical protein